jgi:uncharacterized protein
MSQIKETLLDDIKQTMRDKNKVKLTTLRGLHAAIKQKEIDERPEDDLSDDDIIQIINTMIKQRREAAQQYRDGNRPELADIEETEIVVYQDYLPEQLAEDEISQLIEEAISKTGASDIKAMGQVMSELRPKLHGRADMGKVSQLIKTKLAS